ncbi:hypothetical protein HD806DRAFT_112566 [Xylariaceae sp. AK1471]|nr:hypothetical protein HD806DRAFT_112566 [Xylariaceae sp. AK1471]
MQLQTLWSLSGRRNGDGACCRVNAPPSYVNKRHHLELNFRTLFFPSSYQTLHLSHLPPPFSLLLSATYSYQAILKPLASHPSKSTRSHRYNSHLIAIRLRAILLEGTLRFIEHNDSRY